MRCFPYIMSILSDNTESLQDMINLIHPLPAFTDNYIWTLVDSRAGEACVVDPGDAGPVIDYLADQNLTLTHILITHHHPDHTGGVSRLVEKFGPVVYGPHNPSIQGITNPLAEGDRAQVFGVDFSILEVPGHTLDHIAYFSAESDRPILFCGDTLFAAGCGRLFEGTPEQMHQSLDKLARLPGDTLVYCTHEYTLANLKFALTADPDNPDLKARAQQEKHKRDHDTPTLPSSIALELATNPFLRCDQPQLMTTVGRHSGEKQDSPVATFAALRQWKDHF